MIENLGWIELATKGGVRSFIATGLKKELEVYKKDYKEAGFDYLALYKYEEFAKNLTEEEFDSYLSKMQFYIEENPKELIRRGYYKKAGQVYIESKNFQHPDTSR